MDVSKITVNAQSSIRIDAGKIIYFDPFSIEDEAHDADYIFLTHDHYDHFSPEDISKVAKSGTIFVAPDGMKGKLGNIQGASGGMIVKPGEAYKTDDFGFETVPSYNPMKPFHPKRAGWVGYILELDGKRIYVAGDTDATKEAKAVRCDIALIPIGGTFTMNYKEAASLINVIKPEYVIPTHYGDVVGSKSDGDSFAGLVDSGIKVEFRL